uniref:hypothetical protein n=1 Tax=Thaumasiovibrio occultus TaxID=1891184 RepID=UPI00131BF6E5|nr:hypothetical protein [Thaumasiovibrio occultus]
MAILQGKIGWVAVWLLLALLPSYGMAQGYAIVTASPAPPAELTIAKAKLVFSGRTQNVTGIGRVELIDFPLGSEHRQHFYQLLLNKNEAQMNRVWASLAFSGRAQPPTELDDDNIDTLLNLLKDNPSSIGYLPIGQTGELYVLLEIR